MSEWRTDIWNGDPLRWREMPLCEQLEHLRKFHCTGPCGQSSSVTGNATALGNALRGAAERIRELEEALRAIIAHQEAMGGGLAVLSTTRLIAVKALEKS